MVYFTFLRRFCQPGLFLRKFFEHSNGAENFAAFGTFPFGVAFLRFFVKMFQKFVAANRAGNFFFCPEFFKKRNFHVDFVGADIFPQGFAAVAGQLGTFRGVNMICDIGNGTMNVMFITDCRPQSGNMFTEKFGTNQCMLNIREQLMRKFGSIPDDAIIESVLRFGTADIAEKYLEVIKAAATEYVAGIFRKLREHEYNPDLMKLYVVGGGGCMIKNFGQYDPKRVIIKDDICATAKGYEYMAKQKLQRSGGKL